MFFSGLYLKSSTFCYILVAKRSLMDRTAYQTNEFRSKNNVETFYFYLVLC